MNFVGSEFQLVNWRLFGKSFLKKKLVNPSAHVELKKSLKKETIKIQIACQKQGDLKKSLKEETIIKILWEANCIK